MGATRTWAAAVLTDVGLVRANNEDAAHVGPGLAVVADGMGGHAAGEVASALAVATLVAALDALTPATRTPAAVAAAVRAANRAVVVQAAADPRLRGMGTTVTGLVEAGSGVLVFNVGDSRTYRVREAGGRRALVQLTRDDSVVADLLEAGLVTAAQAAVHPRRHLITAALGLAPEVGPVAVQAVSEPAGRYLLCSDGLSDVLDAAGLTGAALAALDPAHDPQAAARALVDLALAGGGPDNITVAVVDVTG